MSSRSLLAWLAHLYTALGLVCAAGITAATVRGDDEGFRIAFLLMIVATLVDATDGWLARRANVAVFTPGFDGRRLDDLIDFLTYTCLPLFLVWRAGLVSPWSPWWLLAPLLASAYGFSQVNAKTEDHYFLGFPSYWNVIAFYLYLLRLAPGGTVGVLLLFSFLTFVPARYLYPSRGGPGVTVIVALGSAWVLPLLAILWLWRSAPQWLVVASLTFPIYYIIASWVVTVRVWKRRFE
jgi:phosphatidylcholine synthase